jgi:two-component system OmpR family sensor kinase/two-component system sensor histidine kinase BaeS
VNRLWVRLTLAFALVILVTVGAIALLADLTAGQAFRQYLSYTDIARFETLSNALTDYYVTHATWDGVDAVLRQVRIVTGPMPAPMMPRRSGTIDWSTDRFEVLLADADETVIFDGERGRVGRQLTRGERAGAQELLVDDQVVGYLVISRPIQAAILGPLERIFLTRLRWLLVVGALLATAMGALLGLALSRSLTAPLQRLASAARAVANRDFTRRVDVEGSSEIADVARAFNEMTIALERSERQRQNMVADVAHELRSPLSVIQGNLQAILDDVYTLDKAEITRLYDETRLLSRLVDDLRELALADAGKLQLDLRPVDAARVVQTTVEGLAIAAEVQQVMLTAETGSELPLVVADADRLAQILRNLLVNALRHTPAGGRVSVAAQRNQSVLEIAVRDTGEGIAAEDLPHVFDRFWRADPARTRLARSRSAEGEVRWYVGSGLGLSIAQSLVEAQGGRIWAESEPQQGSVFRFTVPLAQ